MKRIDPETRYVAALARVAEEGGSAELLDELAGITRELGISTEQWLRDCDIICEALTLQIARLQRVDRQAAALWAHGRWQIACARHLESLRANERLALLADERPLLFTHPIGSGVTLKPPIGTVPAGNS